MATNPSFDPSLFNSGVSQAQWADWSAGQAHAADQQGDGGPVCAGLDVQDGGGDGRRWSRKTHHAERYRSTARATSTWANARFHCWRKGGHGTLDLRGGLKNSCDVFFYEMARRTGIDRIAAMAHRFGLGTELEIDLPGVSAPA